MKIRILTQNPLSVWFGGVELQASKYIQNIKKWDAHIDIDYFKWDEEDFDILHIVWIHTGINPYWIDVLKKKWVKIVVSSVFYIKPNSVFDYRRPIIYRMFSFVPFHIINWMKQLLQKADIILPNSEEEKKQIISIFWINSEKISILHNGVDQNYFEWVDTEIFKKTYDVQNYILCVSHMEPRKNHLSLIQWFLEFHKNNTSGLKLVLFWEFRWNYFNYHKEIQELLEKHSDRILHIKHLKNSDELFKSAYLGTQAHFLLSSLETPWLSNIEAAFAGKKLILWKCKPVQEYFQNYAQYIHQKNISDIATSISTLNNLQQWDTKQIEFIKENYTWENISKKLLTIYNELWNQK